MSVTSSANHGQLLLLVKERGGILAEAALAILEDDLSAEVPGSMLPQLLPGPENATQPKPTKQHQK